MTSPGPRGYILIVVMMLLLVLSFGAAAFFVQSHDLTVTTRSNYHQQIAVSHADQGLQEALRALRGLEMDVYAIAGTCTDAEVSADTCAFLARSGILDGGSADLGAGGGLMFEYIVYRRTTTDPGYPPNRYVIRSNGYSGYTLTSPNLVTSAVEMELDVGRNTRFNCGGGGYECQ